MSAGIAGVAAEVLSIGLSFGPGVPPSTAWVDVPSSLAIAAVAIVFFVRFPQGREAIAGLVGLVAALVGLGDAERSRARLRDLDACPPPPFARLRRSPSAPV